MSMRKNKYIELAAFATLFAACSSNDLTESSPGAQPQQDDTAVTFGAYVNRGITRAGAVGELTTDGQNGQKVRRVRILYGWRTV